MGFLKNLEKTLSANHKFLLIGLLVITLAIGLYTKRKGTETMATRPRRKFPLRYAGREGMANNGSAARPPAGAARGGSPSMAQSNNAAPSLPGPLPSSTPPGGDGNKPHGRGLLHVHDNGSHNDTVIDPKMLLPKDAEAGVNNPNLLHAGHHVGINTVGTSLRNANLQLRSEPPNPQMEVGPFNNTTIAPDTMRRPLEIGN